MLLRVFFIIITGIFIFAGFISLLVVLIFVGIVWLDVAFIIEEVRVFGIECLAEIILVDCFTFCEATLFVIFLYVLLG